MRNISVCRCLSLSLPVNISTSVAAIAMCSNRMCRRISTDLLFQCMQHGQSLLTRFSASWRNFTTVGWSSGNMIWVGHVGAACFRRATISLHIRTTKFYIISTLHQFRISVRHLTQSLSLLSVNVLSNQSSLHLTMSSRFVALVAIIIEYVDLSLLASTMRMESPEFYVLAVFVKSANLRTLHVRSTVRRTSCTQV